MIKPSPGVRLRNAYGGKDMQGTFRLVYLSLLLSLSLALFMFEGLIPLPFLAPGAKLGLSNIITVLAIYTLPNLRDAFLILVLRIVIGSLLGGGPTVLAYSLGLQEEVRCQEPYGALSGGKDGLDFYRRIIAEAPEHFVAEGRLYLEIGCTQARAVEALMKEHGYTQIRTVKDYAGLDRVVVGEYRQGSSK